VRVAGAILALASLLVAAWGVSLLVRVLTGGMPDSSTGAIVVIAIVLLLCALALGARAAVTIRRTRRR
jgi:hypothetical protein